MINSDSSSIKINSSDQLVTAECVYCSHQQKVNYFVNSNSNSNTDDNSIAESKPYIYFDENAICDKCLTAGSFYYDRSVNYKELDGKFTN
jgi:hypothetical protein